MARRNITATVIDNLKPAKPGSRYDVMDAQVPGFGIRVLDGNKVGGVVRASYIFYSRFPNLDRPGESKAPTRAALGSVGSMSLEEARTKARMWRDMIRAGKDPRIEEAREIERHQAEEARRRRDTFSIVAEAYIQEELPSQRKGKEVASDIRRDLLPYWGHKPIAEISRADIKDLIDRKKAVAPSQARNLLVTVKLIFGWAVDKERYGIDVSPAASIKPSKVFGEKIPDDRTFSDDELLALWHVTGRLPEPFGRVYRILLLTGLRLNEVADARWSELHPRIVALLRKSEKPVDWQQVPKDWKEWVIPADRMKGKAARARRHAVPLTDEMLTIIEGLPRPIEPKGDYIFSLREGEKPIWMSDKLKKRVDRKMLCALRAIARIRGDNPTIVKLERWKNHHMRHTVETRLSKYGVGKEIRDAVLAHAKPGMTGTYNHYEYFSEKRTALELWSSRLHEVIRAPIRQISKP